MLRWLTSRITCNAFDRMIVAQALCESLSVLSNDPLLREYDAPVVW